MVFGIDGNWANVLGLSVPSYPTLMGFAIFLAILVTVWSARWAGIGFGVDCALMGLTLGLIVARVDHVIFHWDYFSTSTTEIIDLKAGGLGWIGALVGGTIGIWLMAKIRRRDGRLMLEAAALAVPLVMFGGWWACEANGCAYGAEIVNLADYPAAWVWEAPGDYGMLAPRWRAQGLGMGASTAIFGVMVLVISRDWIKGWRFPLSVCLSILVMFTIGLLRGDLP
jgi:prolipoprotein diacylglyceryltransferase